MTHSLVGSVGRIARLCIGRDRMPKLLFALRSHLYFAHVATSKKELETFLGSSREPCLLKHFIYVTEVKRQGKGHPCTGTEALYRPYGL